MNNIKKTYFNDINLILKNKKKFYLIIFLYILTSILESIGIGILGPFIALLLNNYCNFSIIIYFYSQNFDDDWCSLCYPKVCTQYAT